MIHDLNTCEIGTAEDGLRFQVIAYLKPVAMCDKLMNGGAQIIFRKLIALRSIGIFL